MSPAPRPIDVIAGARPNFVKVAPLLRALEQQGQVWAPRLVHTGQHYDEELSRVFFSDLGIREPDVSLDVGSGTHGQQTARVIERYERLLLETAPRPATVVVVGDVNSTMACTLAAVKLGLPVTHVEAGLRSFDRTMPEEINRVVTDALADLLLVSEPAGEENLLREGLPRERVHYVGNLMIDSLVRELPAARAAQVQRAEGLPERGYAYVTLHRPSNVDDPGRLEELVSFLVRLGRRLPVVFPVHPRTLEQLKRAELLDRLQVAQGLRLRPALGYRENLSLLAEARFAVTDSGGVQEETTYLGIPCITLRPNTERPVTVTQGTNTVVGHDVQRAWSVIESIESNAERVRRPIKGWDGEAATRVVDSLSGRYC